MDESLGRAASCTFSSGWEMFRTGRDAYSRLIGGGRSSLRPEGLPLGVPWLALLLKDEDLAALASRNLDTDIEAPEAVGVLAEPPGELGLESKYEVAFELETGAVAGELGRVDSGEFVSSSLTSEESVGSSRTLVTERNDLSWKESDLDEGLKSDGGNDLESAES